MNYEIKNELIKAKIDSFGAQLNSLKKVDKNLEYIWDLEKRFKRFKRKNHYKPLIKFGGCHTECFK